MQEIENPADPVFAGPVSETRFDVYELRDSLVRTQIPWVSALTSFIFDQNRFVPCLELLSISSLLSGGTQTVTVWAYARLHHAWRPCRPAAGTGTNCKLVA